MDKIYSRKRIKLPRLRHKKKNKIKTGIFFIMAGIFIAVGSFCFSAYPLLVSSCKTAAGSRATHIVNEEVKSVMENYNYNDLIEIEKDSSGNVVLMKSNTVLINKITSEITTNIQKKIDNTPTIMVYINYGSISGVRIFKNLGPKFDVELEAAGKIDTDLQSEFESVNVNQTIHKIYLKLATSINILTPVGVYGKEVESRVLLAEAVIVGEVPETYYNLENIEEQKDTMELIN